MADDKMDVNALRPLTLDEQAERLQRKGLQFSSEERVKKYLQNVGYCRLKGYFPFFEDPHHRFFEKGEGRFKPDVSFDNVLDLYIFDRKLRLILLEAFERIEVALRSLWQNEMSRKYGTFVHAKEERFSFNEDKYKEVLGHPVKYIKDYLKNGERCTKTLSLCTKTYVDQNKEEFASCGKNDEYAQKIPVWMLVEELNFGKLAEIIRGTQDDDVKKHIACALGIRPARVFHDVLSTLTQIRNICAHHYVLWDREFRCDALSSLHITGLAPLTGTYETYDLRLYNYLLIIAHIVRVLSPQTSWCNRLVNHLRTATPDQRGWMGFPKGPWHAALERDPHSVR